MKRLVVGAALCAIPAALAGCPSAKPQKPATGPAPSGMASAVAPDPLGPRPEVTTPPPFTPPAPVVFTATNGITVWLLERHTVPMVSCSITVPSGSSSDPAGKGGVAYETANMMDEGAGSRGALDFARAVDTLGASFSTSANPDASFATITLISRNLGPGFALLADAVARPRFEEQEWKRVRDLWQNDLKARASDPSKIFPVVYRAAVFGPAHPYGHPVDGTTQSAVAVQLADLKAFYANAWRPDRATLVCSGDVAKGDLTSLIDASWKTWTAPKTPPAPPLAPAPPQAPWPRLVMVAREGAPQSLIAVARVGVAVTDPAWPPLERVNDAIGGSFTSRLNQDLREQRGLSYGAGSSVATTRGTGGVVARAAVFVEKTGEALQAMLGDLTDVAKNGFSDEEVAKTRSEARGDLVSAYETVDGATGLLVRDASLGLGADFEAVASGKRDAATKSELNALAARYFDPAGAVIVVVGPAGQLNGDLAKLGLAAPQMFDADGNAVKK